MGLSLLISLFWFALQSSHIYLANTSPSAFFFFKLKKCILKNYYLKKTSLPPLSGKLCIIFDCLLFNTIILYRSVIVQTSFWKHRLIDGNGATFEWLFTDQRSDLCLCGYSVMSSCWHAVGRCEAPLRWPSIGFPQGQVRGLVSQSPGNTQKLTFTPWRLLLYGNSASLLGKGKLKDKSQLTSLFFVWRPPG